ncbi:MAG: DUF2889 domain-containing protein [Gammaproteobacteria bacterium]|nr:DUF2889 domain-containing protein [Gammaproteobacteria bacterium]MCP5196713.1 DUF2889 domain-containing protein [Gammaproteobacteria bacterium]
MPLSATVPRRLLHQRTIQCQGYQRDDGLWEIEGRMVDTKTYAFPNEDRGGAIQIGEPLHDISMRLTVDDAFVVRHIEARTDSAPFNLCPAIIDRYQKLIGVRIGPGWSLQIKELLSGVNGCTHLTELLGPIATTFFQTVYGQHYDREDAKPPAERETPPVLNTCHALANDSLVVKKHWPQAYTGRDQEIDTQHQPLIDDCLT